MRLSREGGTMIKKIVTDRKKLSKKCGKCFFLELDIFRNNGIINDMIDTAKSDKTCVGLASNQIGYDRRIILVKNETGFTAMVNPRIFCKTGGIKKGIETCLSFPGLKPKVRRYRRIKVEYQEVTGRTNWVEFYEDYARIVQHEIDHLNGKLI